MAKSLQKQGCYEKDQSKSNYNYSPRIVMLRHVSSPWKSLSAKCADCRMCTNAVQHWTEIRHEPIVEKSCAFRQFFLSSFCLCIRLPWQRRPPIHKRRFTESMYTWCR